MEKTAIILAGGLGTRLRPYTITLPKPLVPVGEKPILELILEQLADAHFDKVILAVNHQAEIIRAYFGTGKRWGISVQYSLERQKLGTMGPLKLINGLPDNFLVMNGDILTDLAFDAFLADHIEQKRFFTIASINRALKIDYGVLHARGSELVGFAEKPSHDFLVSMGVYALHKEVLAEIPEGVPYGFDELMHACLARQKPVHLHTHPGYWLDIGRPEDYQRATEEWPLQAAACAT